MTALQSPATTPPSRSLGLRALAAILMAVGLIVSGVAPASASVSQTHTRTAQTNGDVYAVAQVGTLTVIGGAFTTVDGQPRQHIAALRPDGSLDPTFNPGANGFVRALDGSVDGTRIFVGGEFSEIGGFLRGGLAALDTGGSVIADWTADTNGIVHAIEVSGSKVYAAGTFTVIKDATRRRLAALDVTTAAVYLRFNPWPSWTVKDIAVSPDGTRVYAAGGFSRIGAADRNGAGEVLADTGAATAFNPSKGGVGLAVALTPDGSRFFFSTTDNNLYAYDPAVSNEPVYAVKSGGDTQAIAASATEVYFGGHFRNISTFKVKRNLLASITVDGALTDWDPSLAGDMGPWSIELTADGVLVGGDFTRVAGKRQMGIAAFHGTP
ncbi:delta-60 repeat domain-containing protein [Ornithinimicrobium cavernae]|uniref:delta-60 repeat domain-containing protein n=1 Tax=Ornithinimicrobium cavernae TaxID=2666047 RepID=UPI000D68F20A|nr:delta-60 repeat domain-containing protein [Ornithinimicrobium cavernae]